MNATAASNPTLQLCDGAIIERCYTDFGWKYLILTINALSVVINLVHMILMSRLPSLHNTSYHFILQQISIANIYAVIPSVTFLCSVHKLYYGQDLRIAAIYAIIIEHCGMVKYNTLFIASLERYLSICHPLSGQQTNCMDKLLDRKQKIKLFSIFFWIFGLGLAFVKNYVFRQHLCLLEFAGPTNRSSKAARNFVFVFMIIQTLFILAFNVRVLIELRKMQRRNHLCDHSFTRRASHYIIAISLAYYFCLFPTCVAFILKSFDVSLWSYRWPLQILYCVYGIFNVVIYGWVMKPYRLLVKKMFVCCWRSNTGTKRTAGVAGSKAFRSQDTGNNTSQSKATPVPKSEGLLNYGSVVTNAKRQCVIHPITDLACH